MATVTLSSSFNFLSNQDWAWVVSNSTATNITLTNGSYTQNFGGTYIYTYNPVYADYDVSGTATSTQFRVNGNLVYSVTGMNSNIAVLAVHAETYGDTQQTYAYVLNGHDNLTGSAGNDTLLGYAGNDTLFGGAGGDSLVGGAGNDVYVVNSSDDQISEGSGQGKDMVKSEVAWTLGANLENLILTGTDAISGTGNAQKNVITGNAGGNLLKGLGGHDKLIGGGGSDTLIGGAGNDTLTGGKGKDLFKFITSSDGPDTITDFTSGSDKILVVSKNFAAIPVGTLAATRFKTAGTTLTGTAAVFLYDAGTGALSFDSDGKGSAVAVQLATLSGPKILKASDITVVAT